MPVMNKYDLMSDVIPPLDSSQMAMRGYAKGGNIGKLINFLIGPLEESDWLKGIQDLIQEKGGVMKQYLEDFYDQKYMWAKHEEMQKKIQEDPRQTGGGFYHPLNVKKEMFWDPEAIQKTK